MTTAQLDQRALRTAMAQFPSGVVALCADPAGERIGMAASSFVSVSLEPALVAVCIQQTSSTWPRLREAGRLGVSVLAEEHAAAARTLAARTGDRFAGVRTLRRDSGALLVADAALWIESRIVQEVPAGDHTIALLSVDWLEHPGDVAPIVFHRSAFCRLERGDD